MIFWHISLASAAIMAGLAGAASASSSPWIDVQGARVRLVTSGNPDNDGVLRGALEINLVPGWKTYWRDPGDAGVPPMIDVTASTNIKSADLDFPAPERHDEGDFSWAGYDRPVSLPVSFRLEDATKPVSVRASIFLGVCETICVPVKADIAIDPAADPDNPDDATTVSAALASLPAPATADFGLRIVRVEDGKLIVEAVSPDVGKNADVFIAAEEGYSFEEPKRSQKDGRTYFTMEATRPDTHPSSGGLHYTLVTDAGAVSGILPYF
ncbi:protein-disulfide reductase DsbD domain-containing protein [Mesorhizobium sp. IMUNJ 23232]|uniref:protein-disulfide reductase DsbD domain-containing protein n=1 Tax=Mesorhizobium sp. IMUNJ 23232 TaxID=3376064 RepID=UPI0037AEA96E